jgi:hypothetical protein
MYRTYPYAPTLSPLTPSSNEKIETVPAKKTGQFFEVVVKFR